MLWTKSSVSIERVNILQHLLCLDMRTRIIMVQSSRFSIFANAVSSFIQKKPCYMFIGDSLPETHASNPPDPVTLAEWPITARCLSPLTRLETVTAQVRITWGHTSLVCSGTPVFYIIISNDMAKSVTINEI